MSTDSVQHADLRCETCGRVTDHELRYAGRLLESVRCTVCRSQMEISPRAFLPAYVLDLENRVLSKPRRMWRRAAQDPTGFAKHLPRAIASQPAKFVREFRAVFRR